MKIGIHHTKESFSTRWIAYCEEFNVPYKIVDCFQSDIINQLSECDALMWHFHQNNPKSTLFAKQLIYSVQMSGKKVFPDYNTVWHFDDKVGQKYLLEAVGTPLVPSYTFYSKQEARKWIDDVEFPKVFKLRGGAGSANVRLVRTKSEALKIISKAFGRGFSQYERWSNLKERYRKYRNGKTNSFDVLKGIIRLINPPEFSNLKGREKGYVYFQDFIPNNDSDIRVIVINDKAYAIKRMVRKNDFRASGSGQILYDRELIDEQTIRIAFEISEKLKAQCLAYDFVIQNNKPLIVEISFAFAIEAYDACPGYWDKEMNWHAGRFNPQAWMVENLIKSI